ncbi:substrate-binding domain-containing protein [Hoyosella sp. YIM 151337]|uniref:sugar ABC transporter substrate-binding protein n=1 Tax=Hoyosella sp. YIM 151337 TaxID=2992742 RepID=UPI00223606AE|nr:substrate-binding domain-containing protein [Hoyosella sp. YIM 151337]MCW4354679.1 substrate-binding domain-containing protein [Hoyosella sp. YIM 151337]
MTNRKLLLTAIGLVASAALVGACQSSATQAVPASEQDLEAVETAKDRVAAATSPLVASLPTTSPPLAQDKFVVVIPCDQSQPGCTQPALGALEAAEAAGWRAQMIDGKGTGDQQNAAIRQAIALNPDGIITFAIDPATVQGSLQEAHRHGIALVAAASSPSEVLSASAGPTLETYTETGSLLADFAIAQTNGAVRALVLHDTGFDVLQPRHQGFVDRLAECSSCSILEEQAFTSSDLANAVPRLTQQMAQRNPDFNVVYVDYDDAVPPLLQGLRSVGADDIIVLGSNGTTAATACIRSGCGQHATTAFSLDGIGWASIDSMNRVFANEQPAEPAYGIGVKLIDAEVAATVADMWDGDTDYRSAYQELWTSASTN